MNILELCLSPSYGGLEIHMRDYSFWLSTIPECTLYIAVQEDSRLHKSLGDLNVPVNTYPSKAGKLPFFKAFKLAKFIEPGFLKVNKGIFEVGYEGNDFHYDNEEVRHKVYLNGFIFSDMLVTNGDYIGFIKDKGYERFEFWSSDGWAWLQANSVNSPLYWHVIDDEFCKYTLTNGLQKMNPDIPVTHVSFYEAEAFARWKEMRLLTEFEWEVAVNKYATELDYNLSNFQDNNFVFHLN